MPGQMFFLRKIMKYCKNRMILSRSTVKKQEMQAIVEASDHEFSSTKSINNVKWLACRFAKQVLIKNYNTDLLL